MNFGLLPNIEYELQRTEEAINKLNDVGIAFAEKERDYNILLNTRSFELKNQNLAVTFVSNVVKGEKEVANARFERDKAEVNYNTAQEFINLQKVKLRLMESQANREFSITKYE